MLLTFIGKNAMKANVSTKFQDSGIYCKFLESSSRTSFVLMRKGDIFSCARQSSSLRGGKFLTNIAHTSSDDITQKKIHGKHTIRKLASH